jgi:hypothetical protein
MDITMGLLLNKFTYYLLNLYYTGLTASVESGVTGAGFAGDERTPV